ncbi:hypothetical protein SKAU_G00142560 [Synaphobranchus kaupii]|uniref:Uncharacterized protein n=1 Tax=Synaphobranchus kaupii TaxID=118154 RepID=A0A9Q1FSH9_SYNKA|nr:hypothetical protein SKAU_G00142560 [Synaphobranchus kaupii]
MEGNKRGNVKFRSLRKEPRARQSGHVAVVPSGSELSAPPRAACVRNSAEKKRSGASRLCPGLGFLRAPPAGATAQREGKRETPPPFAGPPVCREKRGEQKGRAGVPSERQADGSLHRSATLARAQNGGDPSVAPPPFPA